MAETGRCFEIVVVAELIEQELVALRRSLDLRKRTIDLCRNCSNPPQDVVDRLAFSGDEILRRLGEINRRLTGREATFSWSSSATRCELDPSLDRSGVN